MKTKSEIFDDNWSGLHNVIVDTLDFQPTRKQAEEIFDQLPPNVQEIAFKWGMSDAVFRDDAYEAIEKLQRKQ